MSDRLDAMYPINEAGFAAQCEKIKAEAKGPYHVVVGISGGCDSSYLLLKAVEHGLRPLAVHFDNTWNTAVASSNMRRMLQKLDVDLHTYVVDCAEMDAVSRAFIKAGTPDIDCPTDIALAATLFQAAVKHNIGYIFEGHSFRTEGVCPIGWTYMDSRYIQDVCRKHGGPKLKTLPQMSLMNQLRWACINRIKKLRPLYSLRYDKTEAKQELQRFGWVDYGAAHGENQMSYFYHKYVLPRKYGVIPEFNQISAQVRNGTLTRSDARERLMSAENISCDSSIVLNVLGRLGLAECDIFAARRTHRDYRNYKQTFRLMKPLLWLLSRRDLIPRTFYEKYTSRQYS